MLLLPGIKYGEEERRRRQGTHSETPFLKKSGNCNSTVLITHAGKGGGGGEVRSSGRSFSPKSSFFKPRQHHALMMFSA